MLLDTLNNLELIDILVIIAHLSVILTFWAIGYLLLRKSKDKNEITKNYLIGISLFMILYGISRLLMFLFELQVDPFIWHLQPSETNQLLANNPDLSRKYDLYWYSGTAISALSMAIMLFELERHILKKKTKYGLSIFQVVTITLGLILGASSAEEVSFGKYMLYISSIPALFVPIIYLYYG